MSPIGENVSSMSAWPTLFVCVVFSCVLVVIVVAVVVFWYIKDLCVFNMVWMCIRTKSAPRLRKVLVCYKYVIRLGQTPFFKTCFPCRRNAHLYMSLLAKWNAVCWDVFVIITPCRRNDNLSQCTALVFLVKLMFYMFNKRSHPSPRLLDEWNTLWTI